MREREGEKERKKAREKEKEKRMLKVKQTNAAEKTNRERGENTFVSEDAFVGEEDLKKQWQTSGRTRVKFHPSLDIHISFLELECKSFSLFSSSINLRKLSTGERSEKWKYAGGNDQSRHAWEGDHRQPKDGEMSLDKHGKTNLDKSRGELERHPGGSEQFQPESR